MVVGLLFSCYLLAGLLGLQAHTDPSEMDTTAYLSTAYQIRETGGALNHIQNCLTGVYREATQHPLYPLVLSGFARQDIQFFIHAKWASYWIGFLLFGVYFFTVRKILGTSEALVGLCLLVTSATYLHFSTMIACESLLSVFFLLFWFFAAKGFENQKWWIAAGLSAGFAFLTKSLAILALPIFILSVLAISCQRKNNFFKSQYFYLFFAAFFLISSPLLMRNLKVYGTPFYSDSSAVLWIDQWRDYYRADIKENPPTLAGYLKTHPPAAIASTFFKGFFERNPQMIVDGLKPFAFWENPINLNKLQGFHAKTVKWQSLWALSLIFLCLAGLWKMRKRPETVLAVFSMAVFLVFVGWYSKVFSGSVPTRLLFPILFFIFIFASRAVCDAIIYFFSLVKSADAGRWIVFSAGIYSLVYLLCLGNHFDWKKMDISKSCTLNPIFVEQLRWVDGHLRQGEKIMVGGIFMGNIFYFESQIRGDVVTWPQVKNLEELWIFAHKKSVRYAILDLSTAAYNTAVYHDYFQVGPNVGLRKMQDFPAPFYELEGASKIPPLYLIYELDYAREGQEGWLDA